MIAHTHTCVCCVKLSRLGGGVLCERHGVGGGVLVAGVAPALDGGQVVAHQRREELVLRRLFSLLIGKNIEVRRIMNILYNDTFDHY